ncbi:MAG: lipopolysaccharide biosynthesis protein [Odoribacter sp.]|nr:lipopolysaccharide biosynthesis protein [Odoribacter sp.]
MTESLKHKTLKGTIWSSIERFSVQGVQFIVMIIMARILTPEDYGLVGMLTIFITISQSLIDSGFSQALIRKRDRRQIDNSTVFYFNIAIGTILYLVLFFSAPLIANFYHEPQLIPITRVISLSVFINSLVVVQRALLTVEIDFKTQTKASFTAVISSGILGIWMVYDGYGVWAIVAQQLVNLSVNALLLWILSHWRPSLEYSWTSFRELFNFGSKLAGAGILDTLYKNIYLIIIGKIFKASDLGYYTRAQQFSEFPSSNLTGIIQRVTFPVLCSIQEDNERLKNVYRRFLRLSAFLIFPLMIGLAAVAHPLVILLLKEQWAFTAILLQILCFNMMWYPIHAINLNLLQVKGRSDLFLKLEVYKKIIGVTVLCVTVPMGLVAMCVGSVLNSLIALIINTYYTGKLIQVGFFSQMKDLMPTLFYSLSMGIVVYCIIYFIPENSLKLTVGILVGGIYFLVITYLTGSQDRRELIAFIRNK